MKKNLLICILITLGLQSYSQIDVKNIPHVPMSSQGLINDIGNPSEMSGGDILWSEHFGDSNIPNVTTQDIGGYGDWHWGDESPAGQWSENTGIIESETPGNGFMIMEADFYNTSPQNNTPVGGVGENPINAHFTIGPIDLSGSTTEELVLQFYSNYRICCYYSPSPNNDLNVYISTDGGNTFNDLNYIEGETFEVNVEKETFSQIPLGSFSPNTDDVYFRFEWIGSHYYWMIDDLSVIQRPAYDLKMHSSWLTMEDPASIEYYSIPEAQMPNEMLIGAEVYNYGYEADMNISLFGEIDAQGMGATIVYQGDMDANGNQLYNGLEPDSTRYIETDYFDVSMLGVGTYTFSADIASSGDEQSPSDNALTREFVVSENIYAIDGLYSAYEWTGTGWPGGDDNADGVRFANYFDIKETTDLTSIAVLLNTAEHPTSLGTFQTEPGGEMIAYICDTTGIFNPNVTELDMNFGGVLWESDFYLVSQEDVDNQVVTIEVPDGYELEPNAYYVVIEMYSNGLDSDILIWDDTSVPQPWFASLIFYASDETWYSNPNAASIQLGFNNVNIDLEEEVLNTLEFFPNPAKKYIEINSSEILEGQASIKIYNFLGEVVRSYEYSDFHNTQKINVENLAVGSYILEFENNLETTQHKLIIQ